MRKGIFWVCPLCGCNLDPGERCDCRMAGREQAGKPEREPEKKPEKKPEKSRRTETPAAPQGHI